MQTNFSGISISIIYIYALLSFDVKKKEIFEEEIEGAEEKAKVEGGKPEVPKGMTQRCKTIGSPLLQKFDECDSTDEPWYFTGFTAGTFVCLFVCLFREGTSHWIHCRYDTINMYSWGYMQKLLFFYILGYLLHSGGYNNNLFLRVLR